jgi:PilZ domain
MLSRSVRRMRALLKAQIVFNDGACRADGLIRDLSHKGARLWFGDSVILPERFELRIPQRNDIRLAELKWRTREEIGVEFIDVPEVVKNGAPALDSAEGVE